MKREPTGGRVKIVGTTAVVLAAGRGSRMGDLTRLHQKCMLPLAGRPIVAWLVDGFRAAGAQDILLLVNYRADQVREFFESAPYSSFVKLLEVSEQSTAGALEHIRASVGEHFWFSHGNILFPMNTLGLIVDQYVAYRCRTGAFPAACLATVPSAAKLTHALFRQESSSSLELLRGIRWNGTPFHPNNKEVLSLGLGILNRSTLDWSRVAQPNLMIEGLLSSSETHPILQHPVNQFVHLETEADYKQWVSRPSALTALLSGEL